MIAILRKNGMLHARSDSANLRILHLRLALLELAHLKFTRLHGAYSHEAGPGEA